MEISKTHFVNGNNIHAPFPDGCLELIVGMGCFWGPEKMFWQLKGVHITSVGYSGGTKDKPTYREVCSGTTGHAEVVLVVYQPEQISTEKLLKVFWEGHDPTQYMRQGSDVGSQYRSVVFYAEQRTLELIEKSKGQYQSSLTDAGYGTIVTEVLQTQTFHYAEDYHQQYLAKNPDGYCGHGGCGVAFNPST